MRIREKLKALSQERTEKKRQKAVETAEALNQLQHRRPANIIGDNNSVVSLFTSFVSKVEYGIPKKDRDELVRAMTEAFAGFANHLENTILVALERKQVDATAQKEEIEKLVYGLLEQQFCNKETYLKSSVDGVIDIVNKNFVETDKKLNVIDENLQSGIEKLCEGQDSILSTLQEVLEQSKDKDSLVEVIQRYNKKLEDSILATREDFNSLINSMECCIDKQNDILEMIADEYEKASQGRKEESEQLNDIKLLGDFLIEDIAKVNDDISELKPFIETMIGNVIKEIHGVSNKVEDVRNEVKDFRNEVKDFRNEVKDFRNEFEGFSNKFEDSVLNFVNPSFKLMIEVVIKLMSDDYNPATAPMRQKTFEKEESAIRAQISKAEKLSKKSERPDDNASQKARKIIDDLNKKADDYLEEEAKTIIEEMKQTVESLVEELNKYLKGITYSCYEKRADKVDSLSIRISLLNDRRISIERCKNGTYFTTDNSEFTKSLRARISKSIKTVQEAFDEGEDAFSMAFRETDKFKTWIYDVLQLKL